MVREQIESQEKKWTVKETILLILLIVVGIPLVLIGSCISGLFISDNMNWILVNGTIGFFVILLFIGWYIQRINSKHGKTTNNNR